jgi:hypothetical protein
LVKAGIWSGAAIASGPPTILMVALPPDFALNLSAKIFTGSPYTVVGGKATIALSSIGGAAGVGVGVGVGAGVWVQPARMPINNIVIIMKYDIFLIVYLLSFYNGKFFHCLMTVLTKWYRHSHPN